MSLDDIRNTVQADYEAVNQLIKDNLHSQLHLIDDLSQHLINSGGKRLRPLLVLLGAKAYEYQGDAHINLAVAVEYFHAATLLHDDVIDESSLRHGQETANIIWGSKASVLVGDYLFAQSFHLIASCNNSTVTTALTAAANTITRGEVQQFTSSKDPQISEQQYLEIIHDKTAVLFSASAHIGAILTQRPAADIQAMANYGLFLGNAFQLIDDALDYCASPTAFGKNIGGDLAEGKLTLPLIYALSHGSPAQQQLIRSVIAQSPTDQLEDILAVIDDTGAINYTYQLARQEIDKALTALQVMPNSIFKDALEKLACFAIERKH